MARKATHFTVTPNHISLLQKMSIRYDDSLEFGAPVVDPKRPYGNSDVYRDIAEIINIRPEVLHDWEAPEFSDEQIEYMDRLHREMETVLQIMVTNLGIHVGDYVRDDPYDRLAWTPVDASPNQKEGNPA